MVALLVAVSIVGLVALDHFVLRRRREAAAAGAVRPALVPVSRAITTMPAGVFLQPTFTWTHVRKDGDLAVGVHPLVLGLVGVPFEFDLLKHGEHVEKNAPLIRIRKDNRSLTVRSPVTGTVTAVNEAPTGGTAWNGLDGPSGSWLYRVAPQRIGRDLPSWMIADEAREWTRQQYGKVRDYLLTAVGGGEVGVTMTDGGEIAVGILDGLDAGEWGNFERQFLDI